MNKMVKFIIKIYFFIWLAASIVPRMIFPDYKIISVLFSVGNYFYAIVIILGIIAFAIPFFSKNKPAAGDEKGYKFILHDLDSEAAENLFKNVANAKYFCAAKKMSKCTGCFGCWLKTPGLCVIHDGVELLGNKLAHCGEFIIISKNLYGGFSKEIKNAMDRSISAALPFFSIRNGELHHQMRYRDGSTMKVFIYNAGEIGDTDKIILTETIKANSVNINANCETFFLNNLNELKEALT
jgi:multimeric flavodoxin WrbA